MRRWAVFTSVVILTGSLASFFFQLFFQCIYILHPLYPIVYQWTLRLLPFLGNCKQCSSEYRDVYFFKLLFWMSLDKYTEVELLGHKMVIFLIFWETSILFSTVAASVWIPTNSALEFLFLHILANTAYWFIDDSHSDRYEVALICISLMISGVEHLFMSICHLYVIFVEMSIQFLRPFFNWIVWWLFGWVLWITYKFWTLSLYLNVSFGKYLLSFSG